jgi:hypothetical protein
MSLSYTTPTGLGRVSVDNDVTGEEQRSVATPQAARGWARPPCRHFKIQSCCCLGSALEVAAFSHPHRVLMRVLLR